jgi:hypothetical protein
VLPYWIVRLGDVLKPHASNSAIGSIALMRPRAISFDNRPENSTLVITPAEAVM